jgi:ABC-type nitrate/sulfonate/bicarbonate transport system permease component
MPPPQEATTTRDTSPTTRTMGLVDKASPLVLKCLLGFTLAAFLGICVAMTVAAPQDW